MKTKRAIMALILASITASSHAAVSVNDVVPASKTVAFKAVGSKAVSSQAVGSQAVGSKAPVSRTASFNEMLVRHVKRLCNNNCHQTFSQNGRDYLDFWKTANEAKLDLEKGYTCLRLFYNQMKWCEVIDYTVIEQVLKATPLLFEGYFENQYSGPGQFSLMQDHVEDLMLGRFTDRLDKFHSEPDLFLSRLSTDVVSLVKSQITRIQREDETREYREKIRNILIRFSDMIISKATWYENDYQRIWPSFLSIADSLHLIGTRGIINDQDNLDELWDSLVKRFVWFLDFRGSSLPVEFYEQVEDDLNSKVVIFLELDEQDEGVRTKKEIVAEAIIKGKAKAIAMERSGVFTDQMA